MEHDSPEQRSIINISIVLIAIFVVWLSSFSPIYQKIDSWLSDTIQYYSASETYFDDVIVIDIDDDSLSELEQYLGAWPYKRGDYSLVLDYLYELGAESVVLDILFVDKRPEDNILAKSLIKHPSTVIVGGATKYTIKEEKYLIAKEALYKKLSWSPLNKNSPAIVLPNVLLPQSHFFSASSQDTNIGIVSVSADPDGILRKMPMVYSIGENILPSLPLSTIRASNNKDKDFDYIEQDNKFIYQDYKWPVDEDGQVHLYYPKNANAVLSIAFNDVVKPALGVSDKTFLSDLFEGKTVFIGSTAIQSDMVNTPRGMMGGTYLLSIAYQNLKHQLLLVPNKSWVDVTLFMVAIFPAFIVVARKRFLFRKDTMTFTAFGIVIIGMNFSLLGLFSQQSILLFPLMVLCCTGGMYAFQYSVVTKKRNVELNRLMNELKESNKLLEIAATTDSLTGLYNRRAFLKSLNDEMERGHRSDTEFSVAIMDLDHFKQVNDTYGHQVGDDVLVIFSDLMKNSSRKIDIPARWGGEEFVMLLPCTNASQAMVFLDRLRSKIQETEIPSAPSCKVTVSIGLIDSSTHVNSADELISNADTALYEAKETGRNKICTFKIP